jgi:tetratricopeptide (TPR) repeat protein
MRKAIFCRLSLLSIIIIFLMQPLFAGFKEAAIAYRDKKYKEAIQQIKPDLDQDPNWEPGHRILGLCYLALGDNAQAISEFSQAVKLKSEAFSTYLGLAQAYFNRKEYDKSISTLNQGEPFAIKEKDPKQKVKLYELRGSANFRIRNFADAISDLTNAIRLDPSDWSDFFALGASYLNLDRMDEAIQALEKSMTMKPGQSATTDLLGKAYFQKGIISLTGKQYAIAVQSLLKAKDFDTTNGHIHYRLAEAYLFQKNYLEAEKSLNQSLTLLPGNVDAYERLGLIYEKQKKWDAALSAYKKADQINTSTALKESIARVTENKKNPDQGAAKPQGAKTR